MLIRSKLGFVINSPSADVSCEVQYGTSNYGNKCSLREIIHNASIINEV